MKWQRVIAPTLVALRDAVLDIPSRPGCYVFVGDGRAMYVGQTTNLPQRLTDHLRESGTRLHEGHIRTPWGCVTQLAVAYRRSRFVGDWLTLEYRLIRRLKPNGNAPYSSEVIRRAGAGMVRVRRSLHCPAD